MNLLKIHTRLLFALLVLSITALTGCGTTPITEEEKQSGYTEAMAKVRQGQYDAAITQFQSLKSQTEDVNQQGQADMGHLYALYKKGDFPEVITMGGAMIEQYPKHPQISYVLFLRAMSYQALGDATLARLTENMKPNGEYPENLRNAYKEFSRLVKRFPTSPYNKEVHKHLATIREKLANFELHGAQYYLVQGNYDEVLRRARYVNEYYPNSKARIKALSLMEKAFTGLEQTDKAKKVAREIENLMPDKY